VPVSFIGPDCNNNGRNDACDILSGASADVNNNGAFSLDSQDAKATACRGLTIPQLTPGGA
jgi:hypothetical protein